MNAGGHGSDMQACVQTVKLFDLHSGDINTVVNEDLDFGYRYSAVSQQQIVLGASLQLTDDDNNSGERVLDEIVRWRRDNQPGGQNAGSVFVNPSNASFNVISKSLSATSHSPTECIVKVPGPCASLRCSIGKK